MSTLQTRSFLTVEEYSQYFIPEKLKGINLNTPTSTIPRPPEAHFKFPEHADPDSNIAPDKHQTLLELKQSQAWNYRSMVGYIASMKRSTKKSANTDTSWIFTVVCKLPWRNAQPDDTVTQSKTSPWEMFLRCSP